MNNAIQAHHPTTHRAIDRVLHKGLGRRTTVDAGHTENKNAEQR